MDELIVPFEKGEETWIDLLKKTKGDPSSICALDYRFIAGDINFETLENGFLSKDAEVAAQLEWIKRSDSFFLTHVFQPGSEKLVIDINSVHANTPCSEDL